MLNVLRYISFVCTLTFTAVNYCQAQALPDVENKFNNYQRTALQEKLFVHTNKNAYLAGEILWFKIYNVDGINNRPIDMSKVVYVELLANDHTPVLQAKIVLKNGTGSGSLFIPAGISNGNYLMRAYTGWMKNFSPDYFFEKKITVINAQRSPEDLATDEKSGIDVQFFPEGGHLVKGLTSKVAFKVTGADGLGIADFAGAVVNQSNDTVSRFKPLKFGIGSFSFTPKAGDNYKAVIKLSGKPVIKSMPAVDEQGYVMQVDDNGGNWNVTIKSNAAQGESVYLFAHTRQVVKQAQSAVMSNGTASFVIDKAKLGDGLSHITIFNGSKQPLCERLVFKQSLSKLNINAQVGNQSYNARAAVELSINTRNQADKAMPANLSVSVFRADSLQGSETPDINSYLWLSSELKGIIESPAFYFNGTSLAAGALDNLLLSQGWRRFEWKTVMQGRGADIKFMPEYTGHIISGKLTDGTTGASAKQVQAFLSIPGTRVQMFPSQSDSTGKILFNTKDFYGANEIVVQTNTQYDSTYKAQIFNPFAEEYSSTQLPALALTGSLQAALEQSNINMQVLNIYNAPKLREFYSPAVDTLAFFGKPVKSYMLDSYTRFTTIEEVLREYTSWLVVAKRQGKFKVTMFNEAKLLDDDPLVLYNGIPTFDMNKVFALDPLKIKKLDVVSSRYLYGPSRFDGVLSFTTYKEDLAGYEIDPKAVVLDYEGLQLQRKFYSPVYGTDAQRSSRIPDFRSALFWEPDVYTDAQGKASLQFYTSDQPGKYGVVVQGLTTNGEAGSSYFTFEVKK